MFDLKNGIICELVKAEEAKGSNSGEKFYIVRVLYNDRVIALYPKAELFAEFKERARMSELVVACDICVKNDGSIYLKPTAILN